MTPRPKPDPDLALKTARAFVDQSICECGHANSCHATLGMWQYGECHGELGDGCDANCTTFRPVAFRVQRA